MAEINETVAEIIVWYRRFCYWMPLRIAANQQLLAFIKNDLGWRKSLPKEERDRIADQVDAILTAGEADFVIDQLSGREDLSGTDKSRLTRARKVMASAPSNYSEYRGIVLTSFMAREPAQQAEKEARGHLERLAVTLPEWTSGWADRVNGFGAHSLAEIIGETALISCNTSGLPEGGNYPNPAKLWKRMGTAVMARPDGTMVRQGGLLKSASKDEWIAHAYNRVRRSRLAVIGGNMVKAGKGHYYDVYRERKEYERRMAEAAGLKVVPAAQIPAKRKAEFRSVGHVDKRARRYMEKRLIRDLWIERRRAISGLEPNVFVPAATYSDAAVAAESRANAVLKPTSSVPDSHLSDAADEAAAAGQIGHGTQWQSASRTLSDTADEAVERPAKHLVKPRVSVLGAPSSDAAPAARRPAKCRLNSSSSVPDATPTLNAGEPARRRAKVLVTSNDELPAATLSESVGQVLCEPQFASADGQETGEARIALEPKGGMPRRTSSRSGQNAVETHLADAATERDSRGQRTRDSQLRVAPAVAPRSTQSRKAK